MSRGNDEPKKGRDLFSRVLDARRDGRLYPSPNDEGRSRWPTVWQFLTQVEVDDEHTKEPARISIHLGAGEFVVELVDSALGLMLNCTSPHLGDALDALERVLTQPNPPIRYFKDSEVKLRKRKKKE